MNAADINRISEKVIGAAIEVHRNLGPGLLESSYEECLAFEFSQLRILFQRQLSLPLLYKGVKLDCGYRLDFMVEGNLVVEVKSVERLEPVHDAQLLTYLRLTKCPVGLLINFNVPVLKHGITRRVLGLAEEK